VCQKGGQPDLPGFVVDCGCLDRCDAMLSEALAHDIKSTGERRIAKRSVTLLREWRSDRRDEGFFRVREFALGLGEGGEWLMELLERLHWPLPSGMSKLIARFRALRAETVT
jgi:hypothetical protein